MESRTQGSRPRPRTQKKIQGHGQGQPFRGQTLSRPRTGMLEAKAKDQGHKRKCSPKKKRRSSQKFFKRSPQKNVFQKIFQALHKILTIQKIVLSSSRGQTNFRGLEASRPRPRTSKCVLEDSTSVIHKAKKREGKLKNEQKVTLSAQCCQMATTIKLILRYKHNINLHLVKMC